jgi:hypothetical protein
MSLITRTEKGSKLTIAEMDGNLEYLSSSSFQDGVYSQLTQGTGAVVSIDTTFEPIAVVGTYEGIEPAGGSGTGLIVDVEVTATGGRASLVANYTIVDGGTGYQTNDELTINGVLLGDEEATPEDNNTIILNSENLDGNKITRISVYGLGESFPGNSIKLEVNTLEVNDSQSPQTLLSPSLNLQADSTYSVINIATSNQGSNAIELYEETDSIPYIQIGSTDSTGSSYVGVTGGGITLFSQPIVSFQSTTIQILNEAILVTGLPSEDPLVADQLWNDSGSLKISAGE